MRQDTSFTRSFKSGIAGGLSVATLCSAFVGLMALLRGSDWNDTYGLSTWSVVRAYYLAGLLSGLAYGVLRPLFWGRIGGLILGALLGPVVYGAVWTAVEGTSQFGSAASIVAGVLGGGIAGWWLSRPGA